MIQLSRYSVMRILGSSPEASEIYMISREVNVVQRNGEGICCIIMTDVSSKIRCSPSLFSIALNVMKTTDRAVTALVVESFFDITLPPLRSSRTIHATLRAVTTTGGRRLKNSRVGFNITFQGEGGLQHFPLLFLYRELVA